MTDSRVILQYYFQGLPLAQGKFSYKNVGEVSMTCFQLALFENLYSRKNNINYFFRPTDPSVLLFARYPTE